jgi:DNA-binding MarR family transcriptional regulator
VKSNTNTAAESQDRLPGIVKDDHSRSITQRYSWRAAIASRESGLSPTCRLVALALSLHMSEKGDSCFPSVSTQAGETGLSERSVYRSIAELEERGWLVRDSGGGRQSNHYVAVIPDSGAGVSSQPDTSPLTESQGTPTTVSPEYDIEQDIENDIEDVGAPSARKRKRDPLWDVFDEKLGPVTNKGERGRRNMALRLIRESLNGVSEEEQVAALSEHIDSYRQRWPSMDVTETAIANNWRLVTTEPPKRKGGMSPEEIRAWAGMQP